MSRRTGSTPRVRGVLLVAVGVAIAAVLPLAPVSAVVLDPVPAAVSFVKCPDLGADPQTCDRVLWSSDPTDAGGTVAAPGPAAVRLTAAGYQVYGYDVSADGSTWVAQMRRGGAATIADDSTYALVMVHTDGTHVTSRILTTFWDTNPVISADGTSVWWLVRDPKFQLYDTIYKFSATFGVDGSIGGTVTDVSENEFGATGRVVPDSPVALTISADGTKAAVFFTDDAGTHQRVRAVPLATNALSPSAFQKTYDTTGVDKTLPTANAFTFVDSTTLLFGEYDSSSTATPTPVSAVTGVLPAEQFSGDTSATTPAPAMNDFYDVRAFHGSFLAWKDTFSGSTFTGTAFGTTTGPTVAPAPLTLRTDGDTTVAYRPSEATPPPLGATVTTRLVPTANLRLGATSVVSGRATNVAGYATYAQFPTQFFDPATSNEVDRGVLQYAFSKSGPWTTLRTTTGAHWVTVAGHTYNTATQKLTRTTWFRWTVPEDAFITARTSRALAVGVAPVVTARVTRSGSKRIVSGTATRRGGTALLQRKVGTKYVTVATTRMTTAGAFTFGKRSLVRGTYRVVAVGDASWLTGVRALTV